ncbi:chaperonin 10-like protein [Lyophyllum atratum]|nr:chaperonin 10-like protein [Lyophyllum atratum]
MPQHKALYLDAKFGKFALGYNETPRPGKGELLVRVEAVGLNPVDWSIQKWGLFIETFPAILGTDSGGVVVEVGPDVTNFAVGDRVLYQGSWANNRASYQQFNIATASTTAKIPNFLSFEAAASVPVCLTAAFLGLYNSSPRGAGYSPPFRSSSVGKYAGRPLLVIGGAGSVGQFVHTSNLKSLGATHVLDRHLPLSSLGGAVKGITNLPVEIVYDAVATADTQKAAYQILAPKGSFVVVLNPEVTQGNGKQIHHVFAMPNLPHTSEISANMYSKLTERLEDEVIRPNKVEILPSGLEGVTDGLARLEKGQVSASKLIARPQLTGTIPEKLTVSTKAVQGEKGPIENEKKVVKRRSLFRRIIP